MSLYIQLLVYYSLIITSKKESFRQCFLEILKLLLQNSEKILKNCFIVLDIQGDAIIVCYPPQEG